MFVYLRHFRDGSILKEVRARPHTDTDATLPEQNEGLHFQCTQTLCTFYDITRYFFHFSSEVSSLFALSIRYSVYVFSSIFFIGCLLCERKKKTSTLKPLQLILKTMRWLFWVLFSRFYSIHFDSMRTPDASGHIVDGNSFRKIFVATWNCFAVNSLRDYIIQCRRHDMRVIEHEWDTC